MRGSLPKYELRASVDEQPNCRRMRLCVRRCESLGYAVGVVTHVSVYKKCIFPIRPTIRGTVAEVPAERTVQEMRHDGHTAPPDGGGGVGAE